MRDFWKQTAKLAAIGFALGLLVGLVFLAFSGVQASYARNGMGGLALYLALSGALGAVNTGFTTIYNLEKWGLLRCTLTHFCLTMAAYLTVGFTLGWLSFDDPWSFIMVLICIVAYFIIWLIMYWRYKRQIRRINAALKQWKAEQRDE